MRRREITRSHALPVLVAAVAVCAVSLCGALAATALAGLGPNQADSKKLINEPLDRYHYDPGRRCKKSTPPGTKAMIKWLSRHTRGSLIGTYRCEKLSPGNFSLHAESRAIDWAMDVRNKKEKAQAKKLINKRFLAKDRKGRDNALARRMGIQGLIFDCRPGSPATATWVRTRTASSATGTRSTTSTRPRRTRTTSTSS